MLTGHSHGLGSRYHQATSLEAEDVGHRVQPSRRPRYEANRPERAAGPPESLQEVERRQIMRALAYTRGHQGKAADLLGISRKTLWEKRRRLGIP